MSRRLSSLAAGRGPWLVLGFYLLGLAATKLGWLSPPAFLLAAPLLWSLFLAAFWGKKISAATVLLSAAFCLGLFRQAEEESALLKSRELLPFAHGEELRLRFRVREPPQQTGEYTVLWGEVEGVKTSERWILQRGRLRLTVGGKLTGIARGDRLIVVGRLRPPRSFHNPGGFDYEKYLARRGVAVRGYAKAEAVVRVEERGTPSLRHMIDRLRGRYISWLGQDRGAGGAFLQALLAGERARLDREVIEAFQDTGLAHLLAVSGLHLGLAAWAVYWTVKQLVRRWSALVNRVAVARTAALLTLPAVVVYAELAGMRVPTQRALVMVGSYLLAVVLDRSREVWNTLALAAGIILFLWPEAVFDPSFQLSFLCVVGILYGYPRLVLVLRGPKTLAGIELARLEFLLGTSARGTAQKVRGYLGDVLLLSLIAVASILPCQINYFHQINFLGPFYNLVGVPLVGFVLLPFGLLASLLALVSPEGAGFLLGLLARLSELFLAMVSAGARNVPGSVLVPPLSPLGIVAVYAAEVLLLEAAVAFRAGMWSGQYFSSAYFRFLHLGSLAEAPPRLSRRRAGAVLAAGMVCAGIVGVDLVRPRDPFPGGRVVLAAIDVGQGQALLYRSAGGHWLLIDGGGFPRSDYDTGRNIVGPCLLALGVRELAAVVLTHPHPDHSGGLSFILERFGVGEFWCTEEKSERTRELEETARKNGIPVRKLMEGESFDFEGIKVQVLNPPPAAEEMGLDANNRSLVLRLTSAGLSVLLTGDIKKEAEARLVERYASEGKVLPGALAAHVFSVPHHGSKTSSTLAFLQAVGAPFALLSAGGEKNSGLPNAEVMERYAAAGIKVQRTDEEGFTGFVLWGNMVSPARKEKTGERAAEAGLPPGERAR